MSHVQLEGRSVLKVTGEDSRDFLQGLISNDVRQVTPTRAIHAAFLTPQGKYLHDFMIAELNGDLLLDCEASRLPDLTKRLKLFKLRSKVTIEDVSDACAIYVFPGATASDLNMQEDTAGSATIVDGGVLFMDPRLSRLGARAILPKSSCDAILAKLGSTTGNLDAYEHVRLSAGVPDGSRDLVIEKSILLESGFDELNGVDWNKGCYMGQELTARTKYRGLVKKRLIPVEIEGTAPEPGTPLTLNDKQVGEMRSSTEGVGLALVRLEALETGNVLEAADSRLTPKKPDWATF